MKLSVSSPCAGIFIANNIFETQKSEETGGRNRLCCEHNQKGGKYHEEAAITNTFP